MRKIYTIFRNILVTAVVLIVGVYLILYVALAIPRFHDSIKDIVKSEVSNYLKTDVKIKSLSIAPFNQVVLEHVCIPDQNGKHLIHVDKLGVGFSIWRLITKGEIVLTYAEIVGLDAKIVQHTKNSPTNIQFIIDAFKPKDPNKPQFKYDFSIRSVILRKSKLSYDRKWVARNNDNSKFDANHILITNLRGDISLPNISNDNYKIDIRRISFSEKSGFNLNSLIGNINISNDSISIKDFYIRLNESYIHPDDITLEIDGLKNIVKSIESNGININFKDNQIAINDFSPFLPALSSFNKTIDLDVSIWSNLNDIHINNLKINDNSDNFDVNLNAKVFDLKNDVAFDISRINAKINNPSEILSYFTNPSSQLSSIVNNCGSIELDGNVNGDMQDSYLDLILASEIGNIDLEANYHGVNKNHFLKGDVTTSNIQLGKIINNNDLRDISLKGTINLSMINKDISGELKVDIPSFTYKNYTYQNIIADVTKDNRFVDGVISVEDSNIDIDVIGCINLDKSDFTTDLSIDVSQFNPSALNLTDKYPGYNLSGNIIAKFNGNNIDNANGYIDISNICFINKSGEGLIYDHIRISADNHSIPQRIDINSDLIDGYIEGEYNLAQLPTSFKNLFNEIIPSISKGEQLLSSNLKTIDNQIFNYHFTIKENNQLPNFLKLPVKFVGDVYIDGVYNSNEGKADLSIDIPYLQQGKDKLISNSYLLLDIDSSIKRCNLDISTQLPGKNGDITLMLNSSASNDIIDTDISWIFDRKKSFKGNISLSTALSKDTTNNNIDVDVSVKPTTFEINDTIWHVSPSKINYKSNLVKVDNLKVWKDNQYVIINGKASKDPSDNITIDLKNMDLDYIFETLKINHVNFGGRATGKLYASNLFSGAPYAFTDSLNVKRLTYNKSILGDAILKSKWINDEKRVIIQADIRDGDKGHSTLDGGLWLGKDSLSFECNADYLNVGFLKPFLAAFTSDIEGRATGYAKLYGTFKDIDLVGKIYADTLRMKVDYTNTYYSCSDTVTIEPGHIKLEDITLYDVEGHTAKLNGWVTHRYFHEPHFDFKISEVNNLLAYDTNEYINPDWFGKVYGNGSCRISGQPGIVNIRVDMTTAPNSKFSFVLNDAIEAVDYKFLTFSDKAKEQELQRKQIENEKNIPEQVRRFRNKVKQQNEVRPSKFNLELFISATPQAEMIIVMDPIGGDKIRAFGKGNINLAYNSDDELFMSGTYELEKGSYNFTLQDIILKDFNIRPTSTISFNGDPFEAMLDIAAAYRVNTNLSDLDKSFSYDRDLNSTNIPVEAVLYVTGEMKSPNISFDIDMPTVTQDVVRKVKSIISTDDMMNRQIIYLLALNRFYTPEYMGSEGNNNELASVASSTISSQLSNMLGQLSDNWRFSPYFRTDKGDFSDMEIDLALSSSLLNNRLLLNGNFGYRDRTTSSTTFVGDFDIEYLLNRRGTIRLKAYNHYNDQNYYLKSALTTQGIGVIFKYDFDYWLSFLKKKKSNTIANDSVKVDSIAPVTINEK